ncbi:MAG: hypothetical protein ACKVVP_13135 [Chloroflexota bacterium]
MANADNGDREVLSARAYAQILTSPRLKRLLLPEGLGMSPYTVVSFHGVLDLADKTGRLAVFHRTQEVRFQQQGVGAILDHFWGSGVANVAYSTTAGALGELIHDGGVRHQVIELPKPMWRGDDFAFATERTMMETFMTTDSYFELVIDHPLQQLSHAVLFPKARPCQQAVLVVGASRQALAIDRLPGGKTLVRVDLPKAEAHTAYRIEWVW